MATAREYIETKYDDIREVTKQGVAVADAVKRICDDTSNFKAGTLRQEYFKIARERGDVVPRQKVELLSAIELTDVKKKFEAWVTAAKAAPVVATKTRFGQAAETMGDEIASAVNDLSISLVRRELEAMGIKVTAARLKEFVDEYTAKKSGGQAVAKAAKRAKPADAATPAVPNHAPVMEPARSKQEPKREPASKQRGGGAQSDPD